MRTLTEVKAGKNPFKPDHLRYVLQCFDDDEITELLEAGENFRDLRFTKRDMYLDEMRADEWDFGTGEALGFTTEGQLVNGQHRLSAAQLWQRESGNVCWFWCCYGVKSKAAERMDRGWSRSPVQYLRRYRVPNSGEVAAMARMQATWALARKLTTGRKEPNSYCLVSGQIGVRGVERGLRGTRVQAYRRASTAAVLDTWRRNKTALSKWAIHARNITKAGLSNGVMVAGLLYTLGDNPRLGELTHLFVEQLISGTDLKANDPIYHLRRKLVQQKGTTNRKSPRAVIGAMVIKAWACWMRGEPMSVLRYVAVGPGAEQWPDHRRIERG